MIYKGMEFKSFEHLNDILSDMKLDETLRQHQFEYWKARVNGRISELEPLINELKEKGILLLDLSPELHTEWVELHNVKLFYKF
jgi:hypothetical protein